MTAIEIWSNGIKIGTFGVEQGVVSAKLWVSNGIDAAIPMGIFIEGRDFQVGRHIPGARFLVKAGDEFVLKLVEAPSSAPKD